jgi:cell pole-organizing protein PopZ
MASNPQHEPTMEEILASIRKIISEDSPEASPTSAEARPAAVEADVLELTQEVEEEPAPVPAPEPEPLHMAPMPSPKLEDDLVSETIKEPAMNNNSPVETDSHDGIFSDKTRKAVDDTFANIAPHQSSAATPSEVPLTSVDGRTVDAVFERAIRESFVPLMNEWLGTNADVIVERMKPLIREWMDEHFPALLEGAVRDEVARVARARRR